MFRFFVGIFVWFIAIVLICLLGMLLEFIFTPYYCGGDFQVWYNGDVAVCKDSDNNHFLKNIKEKD